MAEKANPNQIQIFGSAEASGLLAGGAGTVPVERMRENLNVLIVQIQSSMPKDLPATDGGFRMKSFEVAVGIDVTGKVGILGFGTEVKGSASLTLTFERPE